jgi:CubicO group peptidase (beta-lactamase class C family)
MKSYHFFSLLFIFTILSSCHIGRFAYWNVANTDDYKKFDNVELEKSNECFNFIYSDIKAILPDSLSKRDRSSIEFSQAIKESKTMALIIIRNDSILFEEYYDDFTAETIHTSFSMAKSYVSALIGIAIEEGKIESVDDPISKYLSEFKNEDFEKIKIKHLLDMQSGLKFSEGYYNPFGDVAKYYYGRNLTKYLSKLKLEKEPGLEFRYKSVDTQLLAAVLEGATDMKVSLYLEEKIWQQIGTEANASWSIDSKKHQTEKAFCCLNAVARDYARFGRLYLNKGNWNGTQLVPKEWVEESITFNENKNSLRYSYQWWHILKVASEESDLPKFYLEHPNYQLYPSNEYYAEGILGQFLYINPDKNMIIVRLGHKEGDVSWTQFFQQVASLN